MSTETADAVSEREVEQEQIDPSEIDAIVRETGAGPGAAIPILQAVQARYGYLPRAALRRVCRITDITPAALEGVATFYAQFRQRPAGRHSIRVCIGTACHVKGAETVYDAFKRCLEIGDDEDTDRDRLFSVEKVACLGCCMLAPAVQVDDVIYGSVEPTGVGQVLRDFLESRKHAVREDRDDAAAGAGRRGEIRMCLCSSCVAGGSAKVFEEARAQVRALNLAATARVVGCTGISYRTPLLELVLADGRSFRYGMVKVDDVRNILLRHFRPAGLARRMGAAAASVLERILTDETWEPVTRYSINVGHGPDAAYCGPQVRLATELCGELDPTRLDDYLGSGGFAALDTCLKQRTPAQVIEEISAAGLRGRGGGGFDTGAKWAAVREAPGDTRYIVCNADEGDPGAFMDRVLLESFPFRVLEGIAIAAYAIGAAQGYLYVRAEYPLAVRRVQEALRICEAHGYLGDGVPGGTHGLHVRIMIGAGAFVCGEETALLAALEGRRGMPRFRPPYPSRHGLWGKPTLVGNVETFSLVPGIIRDGAARFASLGTSGSKGTKVFALAGKVRRGGLIEVPMGTTLRQVVDDIGGGITGDRRLKAVQVGGPSGGCVPASLMDTSVDYEALASAGAMMGSGGMVVLDETDCMVDIARYFLSFTQVESCGKCTFCRVGTKRMLEIVERLCAGQGREGDIRKLEELAHAVAAGSLCGLGRTAPNPVLSTLRHFREEYDAHVQGRCPAGKCKALIEYVINDDCIGCTRCAQRCPVEAIEIRPHEKHEIDPQKCTRCDTCRQVCPAGAVEIRSGGQTVAAGKDR